MAPLPRADSTKTDSSMWDFLSGLFSDKNKGRAPGGNDTARVRATTMRGTTDYDLSSVLLNIVYNGKPMKGKEKERRDRPPLSSYSYRAALLFLCDFTWPSAILSLLNVNH
jgi:hypothetical protein